jgi:hypothetical protein
MLSKTKHRTCYRGVGNYDDSNHVYANAFSSVVNQNFATSNPLCSVISTKQVGLVTLISVTYAPI